MMFDLMVQSSAENGHQWRYVDVACRLDLHRVERSATSGARSFWIVLRPHMAAIDHGAREDVAAHLRQQVAEQGLQK